MSYFHYYATTSRNLDRVLQYGVFPITQATCSVIADQCFHLHGDARDKFAAKWARWISAGAYASLTSAFFAQESGIIDANARKAVSAEMGVDPGDLEFADYKLSRNVIVSKAYDDIKRLQKYRYGTDAMFLMPILLRYVSEACNVKWPRNTEIRKDPDGFSPIQHLINGHNAWDYGVFAGKAAYWAGETFVMDKSSHYEVVKLEETLQSTGKDIQVNDLLGVYQRVRSDRKLPMIERAEEYEVLRPLLQRMANAYNKHDGTFGMSEITYLIGLDKINIHAADHQAVSQAAVAQSRTEIDKVLAIGLSGIREENRRLRTQHGDDKLLHTVRHKNFTDSITSGAFALAQVLRGRYGRKRPEEYITVRDPGELTNWSENIIR